MRLRVVGVVCCALLPGSFAPVPVEEPLRGALDVLADAKAGAYSPGRENVTGSLCADDCEQGDTTEADVVGLLSGRLPMGAGEGRGEARNSHTRSTRVAASVRRLTIPLPENVRFLFPDEGDSLFVDPETLWLARCIYSESDRSHEQELVAWVVRNRVATGYRGKRSYRDVVLDPFQFSAFNPGSQHRLFYLSLMPDYARPRWRRALVIAAYVRRAGWKKRPFPVTVSRHRPALLQRGLDAGPPLSSVGRAADARPALAQLPRRSPSFNRKPFSIYI